MTYFTERSNITIYAFIQERETIMGIFAACGQKLVDIVNLMSK